MTLKIRQTSRSMRLGAPLITALCLTAISTGCDQKATASSEEPAAEVLVDRSAPRVADLKPEDLLSEQQKKALSSGPGSITYTAPFSGEPVMIKKDPDGLIMEDFVVGQGASAEGDKILKIITEVK